MRKYFVFEAGKEENETESFRKALRSAREKRRKLKLSSQASQSAAFNPTGRPVSSDLFGLSNSNSTASYQGGVLPPSGQLFNLFGLTKSAASSSPNPVFPSSGQYAAHTQSDSAASSSLSAKSDSFLPAHIKLTCPAIPATIGQFTRVNWTKEVGEFVGAGTLIAELDTGSFTIGYKAPESGYLAKIIPTESMTTSTVIGILVVNENDIALF